MKRKYDGLFFLLEAAVAVPLGPDLKVPVPEDNPLSSGKARKAAFVVSLRGNRGSRGRLVAASRYPNPLDTCVGMRIQQTSGRILNRQSLPTALAMH